MGWIADHGLIQVADLDGDLAVRIGDRTEIAEMAVAANPDRRPFGYGATFLARQPLIESGGAAAHVCLR